MVGAGFISFTILNAILSRGARLTIVEVAPRILPRMVDAACAEIVAGWLTRHGVAIRTGVTVTRIEERRGTRILHVKKGEALPADVVIMATGIRTNLEWLRDSGIDMAESGQGGILVDDHLRSSIRNVYAAGDVARGRSLRDRHVHRDQRRRARRRRAHAHDACRASATCTRRGTWRAAGT